MSTDNTTKKDAEATQDWTRFDAMTEAERHAAAMADPDARPMTEEEWARAPRTPWIRIIRRVLRLSREEFALRYHIPVETIEAWEERRSEPDAAALAYLHVIASEPELVAKTLTTSRQRRQIPVAVHSSPTP